MVSIMYGLIPLFNRTLSLLAGIGLNPVKQMGYTCDERSFPATMVTEMEDENEHQRPD